MNDEAEMTNEQALAGPFRRIQNEGRNSPGNSRDARNVGRSDIPAAMGSDINTAQSPDNIRKWYTAQ